MLKSNKELAYGLDVEVKSNGREERVMPGKVVASSSVITGSEEFALVEVTEGELPNEIRRGSWSIMATTVSLRNILVVSQHAVDSENGNRYVTILDDNNVPHKRFVKTGVNAVNGMWILDGIKEGDRVVIK